MCSSDLQPADVPVSPPATGAVIDFAFAIDGVIAARRRIERHLAGRGVGRVVSRSTGLIHIQHCFCPLDHLLSVTSDESFGFVDNPLLWRPCHRNAAECAVVGQAVTQAVDSNQ